MRLIALRLREWRCFAACDLEFPDGLIGVRGANGAGKSTIAEAVGWALFGKLRDRAKVGDLRRQDAPRGTRSSVELEFQLGTSTYLIERFVGGDARLSINGDLETGKVAATNARIAQELDLTWDVFERTVFAQQKDVAALDPRATGPQRKAHVERLLGLERYRRAAERARSEAKARSYELAGLRELAPDPSVLEEALRQAETKAGEDDPAVAQARELYEVITRQRDEAAKAREAEEGRALQHGPLQTRETASREAFDKAREGLAGVNEKLEERAKQADRLELIAQQAGMLEERQSALRKWDELQGATDELATTGSLLAGLAHDPQEVEAENERLGGLRREHTRLLELRPRAENALARAAGRLAALEAVGRAGELASVTREVTSLEAALQETRDGLTLMRNALDHDRAHVGEVKTGGPETPCPTCRKPYGDEYGAILEGYDVRISEYERQLPSLEENCSSEENLLLDARRKLAAAEAAAARLGETSGAAAPDEAGRVMATAAADLDGIDARLAEVVAQIPGIEAVAQEQAQIHSRWLELEATRKVQVARTDRALLALNVTVYAPETHADARTSFENVVPLAEEARALRDALADLPHLTAYRDEVAAQLAQAQTDLHETRAMLSALAFDPEALAALKGRMKDLEERRDEAQIALTAAQLDAQSRSQEVRELQARLDEALRAQKAIADKVGDVLRHEIVSDLLSKYRDEQAQRAWPRLEELASTLLNAATDGRYADIKLSRDYRLMIVDRGQEYDLARFSGGEQDLANLCLRLAIADWVSKERNVELGFVVLDEVFGSQDEERRGRLLGELRALGNRFRQMLVVTHLPEIAELCDQQLEVVMDEPGLSSAHFT